MRFTLSNDENSSSSSLEEEFEEQVSSSLNDSFGVCCLRAFRGRHPFFHTTLVLTALGTRTAENTMSGQGTPKKVKLRLVRTMDGDLSIQLIFFAHFVQLHLILYSIPSY